MKYYIIAGEASGDLHGSNLIKGLKKVDPEAEILAWGGEKMQQAGAKLRMHYKDLAIMGFVEVLTHLGKIRNNFDFAKKDIVNFQPDVLITIDFPGFNLRMAKWAHKNGFKTFHYISPTLWAWNTKRVYQIRKNVDKLFVILPFEPDFYKDYDMTVEYEGHPLLDAVHNFEPLPEAVFRSQCNISNKPVVAILPGSRKQEIARNLPLMLKIASMHLDYEYLVAGAPSIDKDFYHKFTKNHHQIKVLYDNTYNILDKAVAGMITSGTATLEAALFNVPQVVCYKSNPVSFYIARMFVKNIRWISLVNLIMQENAVTELIQNSMTPDALNNEFEAILPGHKKHDVVLNKYRELRKKIGEKGVSTRIAQKMYNALQ